MKNRVLFLLSVICMTCFSVQAQRGVRIGYIDTEYILQNVPEYNEASTQLESKVQKWKGEIDQRLSQINQKKKQLEGERVLLTKELLAEREEDLAFEEKEILDYQQKRFGPKGDLMIQKQQLIQPVQDQIFAAVQEIAKNKKYDFVFDKSADVVMLYSANRFDISEQVLRSITRSSKRKQATSKKERKQAEEEDIVPEVNLEKEAEDAAKSEALIARQKLVDDKRAAQLTDRESKKKALEDKKKKILEDRAKARQAKIDARNAKKNGKEVKVEEADVIEDIQAEEEEKINKAKSTQEEEEAEADKVEGEVKKYEPQLTEREKRKKALEEKKKRILEERRKKLEERKKAKEDKEKQDFADLAFSFKSTWEIHIVIPNLVELLNILVGPREGERENVVV